MHYHLRCIDVFAISLQGRTWKFPEYRKAQFKLGERWKNASICKLFHNFISIRFTPASKRCRVKHRCRFNASRERERGGQRGKRQKNFVKRICKSQSTWSEHRHHENVCEHHLDTAVSLKTAGIVWSILIKSIQVGTSFLGSNYSYVSNLAISSFLSTGNLGSSAQPETVTLRRKKESGTLNISSIERETLLIVVTWNLFRVRHSDFYSELDLNFLIGLYNICDIYNCNRDITEKLLSNSELKLSSFRLKNDY